MQFLVEGKLTGLELHRQGIQYQTRLVGNHLTKEAPGLLHREKAQQLIQKVPQEFLQKNENVQQVFHLDERDSPLQY